MPFLGKKPVERVSAAAQPTITSLGTLTTLTVDSVAIDDTTIGHISDTDLLTLTSGVLTVAGNIAVSGTVDGIDIATRDAVLTSTTTTAGAALPKAGGAMTGAITTNSTFDGRDVATDGTKLDTIESSATADQTKSDIEGLGIDLPAANLTGTVAAARLDTATTTAESDDSTKIATTAYVTDKITTLIGGAPSTLNDLNELAAAINDDANYNSTLTTALATKLPLAGGTMTGDLILGDNVKLEVGSASGGDLQIYHDGSNSYIKNTTGWLNMPMSANGVSIANGDFSEQIAKFVVNGACELYHNGSKKLETVTGGVNVTGTLTPSGVVTANAGVVVDNFTLDGTTLALSSGDMTLDAAGDINLDADGGDVILKDGGTTFGQLGVVSSDLYVGTGDTTLQFVDGQDVIQPTGTSGAQRSDLISLGDANNKFKDLNLSGGVKWTDGQVEINSSRLLMRSTGDAAGLRFDATSYTPFKNGSAADGTVDLGFSSGRFKDGHFSGTVNADKLAHDGDSNTYLDFGVDQQTFYTGGVNALYLSADDTVINNGGADMDFRVESDGNDHMLFVDGGNNRVGIGRAPASVFEVHIDTNKNIGYSGGQGELGSIPALVAYNDDGSLNDIGLRGTTVRFASASQERLRIDDNGVVVNEGSHDADFRVESNGNANMIRVDGGNNRVGIGTSNPVAQFAVGAAGRRIEVDGDSGVIRGFDRSASWAALDFEASAYTFDTSTARMMDITATGVIINEDSADADFRVESNGNANMLFVDGGANRVGIGTNAPQRALVVAAADSAGVQTQYINTSTGSAAGDGFTVGINGSEQAEFWNYENTDMLFANNGAERLRIASAGQIGIGGANYGTDGQVLTSTGTGSAPAWEDAGGGAYSSWLIKTANFTCASGDQLICNHASTAFTITLPAGSAGDTIIIANAGAATVTVGRNGSEKINSAAADGTLPQGNSVQLVYVDSTIGWFEV